MTIEIAISSGVYDAFICVDGVYCDPGSKLAQKAEKGENELCEKLRLVLHKGNVFGIPVQEFLHPETEILPKETLTYKDRTMILYALETPWGTRKYTIKKDGEVPKFKEFRQDNDHILRMWELYKKRGR
jgi:hypothetical protein